MLFFVLMRVCVVMPASRPGALSASEVGHKFDERFGIDMIGRAYLVSFNFDSSIR